MVEALEKRTTATTVVRRRRDRPVSSPCLQAKPSQKVELRLAFLAVGLHRHTTKGESLLFAHVLTSLAIGGAERMTQLLALRQHERGYRVIVVSLEEPPRGPLTHELEEAGVPVVRVPKRPGFDPTLFARLFACFRHESVEVVHTHNTLPLVYASGPARLVGARVVHTKHSPQAAPRLRTLLKRMGAAVSHVFAAVSDDTATFAKQRGEVASRKLRVIPNATDLSRFRRKEAARATVREAWGVQQDTFVIGTVGRMVPEKNHSLLLRASVSLIAEGAVLVIAGDGPMRASSEALAQELDITDSVRFLGTVPNVEAVVSGFDVFALSSSTEGLPMVLVEAMGASLPIVGTAVGGVPKVIQPGKTGHLVPANNEAEFARALRSVRDDRKSALDMGEKGRELAVKEYSLDRLVDDYLTAYGK